MQEAIHPNYHNITVKMTNGTTFETRSCWGEEGSVLQLDVDITTHPAWTGGVSTLNENAGQVAKFKNRFGNLGAFG